MLKLLQDTQLQPHIKYTEIIQCRGHEIPYQSRNDNIYLCYIPGAGGNSPVHNRHLIIKVNVRLGVFEFLKLYQLSKANLLTSAPLTPVQVLTFSCPSQWHNSHVLQVYLCHIFFLHELISSQIRTQNKN